MNEFANDENLAQAQALPCPICGEFTDSLKQFLIIKDLVAIPFIGIWWSTVYVACPSCMRSIIWKRCLINGLTTWLVGYLILIPYTLFFTLASLFKGHSFPVNHDITPEMHLARTWECEPTSSQKWLAIISVIACLLPGLGILVCWYVLWKNYWCTGWVHRAVNYAAFFSYIVTLTALSMWLFPEDFRGRR